MRLAGSTSWRITVDNGRGLNAACYVRDVAGLPIGDDSSVPPRLVDVEVGQPSSSADDAALGWRRWWAELVARVGSRPGVQIPQPPSDAVREASPALGRIADDLFSTASRWAADLPRRHPAPYLPPFAPVGTLREHMDWDRVTAEEVVREYAVTPDRVQAHIEILWSDEPWAEQPAPGVLLCSLATWSTEEQYRPALKSTFEHGLGGSRLGVAAR